MVRMFVRHAVADYPEWRKVFDEFFDTRRRAGVIGEAVFQSADDLNDITLTLDFATLEAARAFPENPELKAALHKAGSVGAPTQWFATET